MNNCTSVCWLKVFKTFKEGAKKIIVDLLGFFAYVSLSGKIACIKFIICLGFEI